MSNEILTDLVEELGTNFIEYAVAVNTDRSIPDANTGLKPVAKRILYGAYDNGFNSKKPHVKCANIVGNVMADWHPHGDSSIYGALTRLAQDWVMRYPLIDWHGNKGNRDGDPPAHYRYTEARLSPLVEDGMLVGMKKGVVDFVPNYSETKDEPVTLPSYFPNLLCNPNTGIGVAIACNWAPHNLHEVAKAIFDYMEGKEPMLPGPDFPTGGIIINKNDIPSIMRTGHGTVKIRGKYNIEDNNIVFYEIPYGIITENLMEQIGKACDDGDIEGITDVRNESTRKKGFRLVLECGKNANLNKIISQLFKYTDLQSSFSYNQVGLISKTPTELNLKDCCKIYVEHNSKCICREAKFDLVKAQAKLEIDLGLVKALEDIDNIIALIKTSKSAATAKVELQNKYKFSEPQAHAIVEMKLGKLAGLEKIELDEEISGLQEDIDHFNDLILHPEAELKYRLTKIVEKYGDERRTDLVQLEEPKNEDKEIVNVEPEKCIVILTEGGSIKRMPTASFHIQRRNTKGVKTQDDITSMIIRTNTIDNLMIFTNKGKMYRLLVNDIPEGTNASKGTPIRALIEMESDEHPNVIYSIYRDTDAKYVMFVTKYGITKKTSLDEYIKTKRKNGLAAINLKEGDSLAAVFLIKDEEVIFITKDGYGIKISSLNIPASSRTTMGLKGITFRPGDTIFAAKPIRDTSDYIAVFSENGLGKRFLITELPVQNRGGKGLICYKTSNSTGNVAAIAMVEDTDTLLVSGNKSSICIAAKEIPILGRGTSTGNLIIKNNKILSVSKV